MQTIATPTVPKQLQVEQLPWDETGFTVRASAPPDAPFALTSAKGGHRRDLVVTFPYGAAWGVPHSAVRNSFPWASSQRTRATSWAAFLTCPWEVCRSSIIEWYFPRALLSGLAASKVGSASISASSKGWISW